MTKKENNMKINDLSIELKENLIEDYCINKISAAKLGKKYGFTGATILKFLKRNNIKTRTLSESHIEYFSLIGKRFGLLTVVERYLEDIKETKWICRCDCGNMKIVFQSILKSSGNKSCGCKTILWKKEGPTKHGKSRSPIYRRWVSILERCGNKDNIAYSNYGERGIYVCDEWLNFSEFYKDMGEPPFRGAQIDRIDNNKGYSKDNCRWTDAKTQNRNKRTNIFIMHEGEKLCLKDLANKKQVHPATLKRKMKYNEKTGYYEL